MYRTSSIGDGSTSALFQSIAKIRAQFYERKLRAQFYERKIRAQFYERKTRNSIFWKFLGNHMMEISWKLYAGKFRWIPAVF